MPGAQRARVVKEREAARTRSPPSSSGGGSSADRPHSDAQSNTSSPGHRRAHGGDATNDSPPPATNTRDPAKCRPATTDLRNIDLPVGGWSVLRGLDTPTTLPPRPKPSTLGAPVKVGLNTFNVKVLPTANIYQYDVLIGSGAEKRGLITKVWASQALKAAIGSGFIFDGNKLAWSLRAVSQELKLMVDLDKEQGRTPKAGKEDANKIRVVIRNTNKVRLDVLVAYLEGKITFDNAALEAINFLDHLLREYPATRYTTIKRSFFARGKQRFDLGSAVEAFKGVYQSMRIGSGGFGQKATLTINLDVSNGTFWKENNLHLAAKELTGARDIPDLITTLQRQGVASKYGVELRKLRKLHVFAKHRGKDTLDEYVIDRLIYQSARDHKFEKDGKQVSLYDYYAQTYSIRLQFPDLPLCKMTKKSGPVIPMELLSIGQNQRYVFKMDERQTANMIKFAVTPPNERWGAISDGLNMLDWANDPVLKTYGMQISPAKTIVDGRLLVAPKVSFSGGEAKPGTSGRWDLKGKKFLTGNPQPLTSWAVGVVSGRRGGKPDKAVVMNFVREFIKTYAMHGGNVTNREPPVLPCDGTDVGGWVTQVWNAAGKQHNTRPQMLVFILPDKDSSTYGRIKKSADCRYGVVSQCMQYAHVMKCQGQYISNVCMKFNAKLGGSTARAIGPKSGGPTGMLGQQTMILGADVSHAAPGAAAASMAALTASTDRLGIRYAAACETNGYRVEMITKDNITSMLNPLLENWVQTVGGGNMPERVIYFRDGVSEGQYQHVLQQEVHDMKEVLKAKAPNKKVNFVVIVGGKRHHVRFFPEKGDRNGNPLPGTLIESGVTHPYENDFYLCSHAAIKGTARPMHYHVIMNEANMSNEEIQTMIYEHCYQYIRATTPVSQHPAIYYAHIAALRAAPHDPTWGSSSSGATSQAPGQQARGSGSQSDSQGKSGGSSGATPTDFEKLLPMPKTGGIERSMWFI